MRTCNSKSTDPDVPVLSCSLPKGHLPPISWEGDKFAHRNGDSYWGTPLDVLVFTFKRKMSAVKVTSSNMEDVVEWVRNRGVDGAEACLAGDLGICLTFKRRIWVVCPGNWIAVENGFFAVYTEDIFKAMKKKKKNLKLVKPRNLKL